MTMTLDGIRTSLSPNPAKDFRCEFVPIKNNKGNGAFSDVTYFIVTEAEGGAAPPSTEYGYIYPVLVNYTVLYYHPETDPYMKSEL
ncbi:13839_t:CDS:2 [Racocetra persica]|uniref:13839_t:CDS:1 n=1 Tax=Racocetra persica TaxID=160502 RepID=A0ACA9KTE2_9GLOM|nr:13839_t:CDS:2 [Racocetra persica]